MRLSILGLFAIAILVFSGCNKSDSKITNEKMTDGELIQAIKEASNKQNIEIAQLPSSSKSTLEKDYAEDIIDAAKLAPELGYEVDLREGSGPRVAAYKQAFFNMEGRELRDDNGERGKGKGKGDKNQWGNKDKKDCFEFVLPVTFIMPDDSEITIENKEDWALIKAWYEAHPDVKERPAIHFPVDIIMGDKVITVNNSEEMHRILEACNKDYNHKKRCFELIYPVTFIMADGTEITIKSKDDKEGRQEMKAWYEAHPDADKRHTLQFPVDIKWKDGTVQTINSEVEMRAAKKKCGDGDWGKKKCFKLVFPVTYIMLDGTEITVNSKDDKDGWASIKDWYTAHPDVKKRPAIKYPVDIEFEDGTIISINSKEEMKAAWEECEDEDED